MTKYDKSALWDSILDEKFRNPVEVDSFKCDNGQNSRITQYCVNTHGVFFLKTILFQMVNQINHDDLELLRNIPNREIGGGHEIVFRGLRIDLDYLLALEEILFLKKHLLKTRSILEIGAGYGRTCHSILSLFPNIEQYEIVDLPEMLSLSKTYLQKVSTRNNLNKIKLVSVENFNEKYFDLIVNIDSMQEMDCETTKNYLNYIDFFGKSFYSKNTVGKFEPELCGFEPSDSSCLAMSSGLLTNTVNIFCPEELKKAQKNFLIQFSPGKDWFVSKHAETIPWSHYYQSLFIKNV
jgi:hypothetical protein